MSSTVQLSFRYVENDFVHAIRAHYAARLRLRRIVFLLVVLVGAGLYLWQSPRGHWLGVVSVSFAVLFALVLAAAFFVIPPLTFRREPKFQDEYSLAFSPAGIHFRTSHIDSQLQWSMYSKVLIDPDSYLLYYGTYNFTLIPKRVFQGSEQQQTFESLLMEHVPEIVTRAP